MSILDNIKNKIAPEKKPGDDIKKAVDKAYASTESAMKAKEKRQRQISDCSAVLRDCRFTFQKTISVENALAGEMRRKGYDTTKQSTRVREAAIGILVVDQALFELQSINSEADLNSAMNKMGMALRQLRRVDNSTAAISSSTERIVNQWYPGALGEEVQAEQGVTAPTLEVPEEMRAIIDDTFVENLMMGDGFELAMAKRNLMPKPDPTQSNREDILSKVRQAVHESPKTDEDFTDVIRQNTGKF